MSATLAECKEFRSKFNLGEVTADQVREEAKTIRENGEALTAELKKMTVDQLLKEYGGMSDRKSDGKKEIVKSAYTRLLTSLCVGGISWNMFSESYEDAIAKALLKLTDEQIQEQAADRKARQEEFMKSLNDPETLAEFDRFVSYRGIAKLSDEQLETYDRLLTEAGRARHNYRKAAAATVKAVELTDAQLSEPIATKHTQKGHDLWVIQLSDRVDREKYTELLSRAKRLGGSYSSYAKDGAIPGFQFKSVEAANEFRGLDKVDGEARLEAKEEKRSLTATERLLELAHSMRDEAFDVLGRDRKANTWRRIQIANSMESRANGLMQLAGTITAIANAIKGKEVQFIDRLAYRTEFEDLESILTTAKYRALRAANVSSVSDEWHRSVNYEDIKLVEYPYPNLHNEWVRSLIDLGSKTSGCKMVASRLTKIFNASVPKTQEGRDRGWSILFNEYSVSTLRELVQKLKGSVPKNRLPYCFESVTESLLRYDRMQRLELFDAPALRTALREYLQYRGVRRSPDPIKQAERVVARMKIKDFFPTPKETIAKLIDLADVQPDHLCLEPGAGRGDIVDELIKIVPKESVHVCEINGDLQEILRLKEYNIVHSDLIWYESDIFTGKIDPYRRYDRIVANLPFTDNEDILHCYALERLLAKGGRMVAIVGAGSFQNGRSDDEDSIASENLNKFQRFRRWLDTVGADVIDLPDDTFKNGDRPTGARCKIVVVDR